MHSNPPSFQVKLMDYSTLPSRPLVKESFYYLDIII